LADPVPSGGLVRAGFRVLEKASALGGVMAELMAEDAEGVGGITEATSGLRSS
jgi:hypothetical protein